MQSTNDNLLRLIGRIHTYQEFLKTYEMAVNTGFKNINVDLMIGLPNQTIGDIKESIDKITSLNPMPQHISVYSLIVEPNTLMEKWVNEEKFDLPLDEEERNQYAYVKNILEQKGYKHYEISNFSLPGKQAIHKLFFLLFYILNFIYNSNLFKTFRQILVQTICIRKPFHIKIRMSKKKSL